MEVTSATIIGFATVFLGGWFQYQLSQRGVREKELKDRLTSLEKEHQDLVTVVTEARARCISEDKVREIFKEGTSDMKQDVKEVLSEVRILSLALARAGGDE